MLEFRIPDILSLDFADNFGSMKMFSANIRTYIKFSANIYEICLKILPELPENITSSCWISRFQHYGVSAGLGEIDFDLDLDLDLDIDLDLDLLLSSLTCHS